MGNLLEAKGLSSIVRYLQKVKVDEERGVQKKKLNKLPQRPSKVELERKSIQVPFVNDLPLSKLVIVDLINILMAVFLLFFYLLLPEDKRHSTQSYMNNFIICK